MGREIDVVDHDSDDQDEVLDDNNATTLFPQALLDISKFSDAPDFCLSEKEDLMVSDVDMDGKDMLQAKTIIVYSTKYRALYRSIHMVLTGDRLVFLSTMDGKVRLSEAQYTILSGAINSCNGLVAMLDVLSIRRTLLPAPHGYCYPKSEIVYIRDILQDDFTQARRR